jgi:hypothetical protein
MGLILTITAALCLWLAMWALGIFGGFDAILVAAGIVVIAIAVNNLLPFLPGRQD